MTAFCGISRNYWQLLLARIGVGIGEAGGTPGANSILSDYFPVAKRPMALTVFSLGAPIGAWLGASVAGDIADHYGWRSVFLALGLPGVAIGIIAFLTIPEPIRGRLDALSPQYGGAHIPGIDAVPVEPALRRSSDHGNISHGPVGLGPDVVDAHVPGAQLRLDNR